ncbi:XVIPCD domain-containing protein, partial [Lysobacter sp. 2RAB21]
DRQIGKPWDEQSERISASLLTRAAQMKFSAHDDVRVTFHQATASLAPGEVVHVYRVGHASPDPAAHHAHMTTADALSMPADERYRQVGAIRQSQNAEAQRQQQELTRGMNGQDQSAQKLAM